MRPRATSTNALRRRCSSTPTSTQASRWHTGTTTKGYRIVGTEHSYVAHYGATLAEGQLWAAPYEVTAGARVAENLGLHIGDTFFSAHGLKDQTDIHTNKTFTVVGILEPSGSVVDQLLLTPMESIWYVHMEDGEVLDPEKREITAMLLKKRNPSPS